MQTTPPPTAPGRAVLLLLVFLCSGWLVAQTVVTGRVLDEEGVALIGVSVYPENNTAAGTVTDLDGNYTLNLTPEDDRLVFSYVGYERRVEPINGRTTINVTMGDNPETLQEVVVVAYGEAKREDIVNWIVARFQTTATNEADTITMWINPPTSGTPPDTTSAGFALNFTTTSLQDGIDGIRLRTEGGDVPYVTQFDEIAIATQWSSIVGTVNAIHRRVADPFAVRAYPNPFATDLTIEYDLPASGKVTVGLLNLNGQVVRQLLRKIQPAGSQRTTLNATMLPGGVYLLRIDQGQRRTTRKVVLLR